MSVQHRRGIIGSFGTAIGVVLCLATSGCATYRGPRGVESAVERKMGVELHREIGFKLGPASTKFAASFLHDGGDDEGFQDLTRVDFAVFEVTKRSGAAFQPLTAADLGVRGWRTLIESRSEDEQLLVLAKPQGDRIREILFFSNDGDEVVVARLEGRLDRLIEKMLAADKRAGAEGARAAIGVGSH